MFEVLLGAIIGKLKYCVIFLLYLFISETEVQHDDLEDHLGRQDPDEVGEVVEDVRDEDYGRSPPHRGDDAPGQEDRWSCRCATGLLVLASSEGVFSR